MVEFRKIFQVLLQVLEIQAKKTVIEERRWKLEPWGPTFWLLWLECYRSSELPASKSLQNRCYQRFPANYISILCRFMKNLWRSAYMQRCLRAWGGGAICLRERAKLRLASMSLYGKIENVAGVCGDGISLLMDDLMRGTSFCVIYALGKDLNQRCISQEFQGCISWCHSRLFWAYSENLCVFWYF